MRDTNRIPRILEKLRIVWEKHPDMRLNQLMFGLTVQLIEGNNPDAFYVEDDKFEKALDKHLEKVDN